ncbi:hypothetical protein [Streptomyces natalensis]|uniref:Uncharacterized protein n=1 Tax=Streptomyces natalensis ATCC 27448 TaxID=1240678 RepID=A0A0D7CL64_9ACTN|nr:hypothetical protein [Streptomyces natalensis]KIZ16811.1 hypothetical protein SNA_17565 [Streptomyces natalensis ATCC 27448]
MGGRAPIVVHQLSATGGRRVVARGQILGLAYSDADLVEFLRRAGVEEPERILDDDAWVEWRGGRPHDYGGPDLHSI